MLAFFITLTLLQVFFIAAATVGTQVYLQHRQEKAAEERQKKQTRAAQAMQEKQAGFDTLAGEHWEDLSKEQMLLQSQTHQMDTLLDLIKAEETGTAAQQVFTLPPAKAPPAPMERLNQAIDDLIRGSV